MDGNPELASEMLALMSKELKAARLRIKELEDGANITEYIQRAEVAEQSLETLKVDLVSVNLENESLRAGLEELRDAKSGIKREHPDRNQHAESVQDTRQHSLPGIEHLNTDSQSSEEKDGHIKDLESALEKYYGKYKAEKHERKDLTATCKTLEDQVAHLEKENEGNAGLEKACQSLKSKVSKLEAELERKSTEDMNHVSSKSVHRLGVHNQATIPTSPPACNVLLLFFRI
ncbi:hypothetical protein CPB84DRAFT_1474275 [Gymnopilus junonius]|uniref:Uncharacterized protein n=1 Tax=Gymnopilus junonius TaxID=109634 RepID=A0A9P5NJ54_GYMJU|nr:hypothetical protein CPB84DRAFT_1474275 [Gymnopilus junonius]